jgi:hypothetical protein
MFYSLCASPYAVVSAIMLGYFLNTDYCHQNIGIVRSCCSKVNELRKIKKTMGIQISYKMVWMMCWLLWTTFWLMLSQWLNSNVVAIGKNRYMVIFAIGGKRYATIIKHQTGPSPVLQVIDNEDNDITNIIEPYVLFKQENITPGDVGYDSISIMNQDGTDTEYNKNDIIKP